jgi:hypothetical protein
MKTTPDGLTHLINMLVDVVNLQRKALGTPNATCEVQLDFAEVVNKVAVRLDADVDITAPPPVFSAENNRPLTPEAQALEVDEVTGKVTGLR